MPRLPADTSSVERLATLEAEMKHVRETTDLIRVTQLELVAKMHQAEGAAWLGRWLLPGITGVIGFVASKLGTGALHLP